jgi:hypothetical protein
MKTNFIPIVFLAAMSCSSPSANTETEENEIIENETVENETQQPLLMGKKINGDFNGDQEIEEMKVVLLKEGYGNPQTNEEYEPNIYGLEISNNNISLNGIELREHNPYLINEGDLTGNGNDEISVISYSPNGTQIHFEVFSFDGKNWSKILVPQMEVGSGTDQTLEDLQNKVYSKNGNIYYLDADLVNNITEKKL